MQSWAKHVAVLDVARVSHSAQPQLTLPSISRSSPWADAGITTYHARCTSGRSNTMCSLPETLWHLAAMLPLAGSMRSTPRPPRFAGARGLDSLDSTGEASTECVFGLTPNVRLHKLLQATANVWNQDWTSSSTGHATGQAGQAEITQQLDENNDWASK